VTADTYPRDASARATMRQRIRDDQFARAEIAAARLARSLKCGEYGQHADQQGGCANNGATCLCECHDLKGALDA
jgi:hypothetical protein